MSDEKISEPIFPSSVSSEVSGTVQLDNGSVTNPPLAFTNDVNEDTGIYRIGENALGITCGGIKQMDINTTRILTTNPINLPTNPSYNSSVKIGDNGLSAGHTITATKISSTNIDISFWNDVCWSPDLERFVAVAYSTNTTGVIAYSDDGLVWVLITGNTDLDEIQWSSICWSPELEIFVAIAQDNTGAGTENVGWSSDGITWNILTVDDAGWFSVCWSPELGLFVAVATSGTYRVIYSSDGITWDNISNTDMDSNDWRSICWSAELGLFVAVATSGTNRVMYSDDGISWDKIVGTNIDDNTWTGVCWSSELEIFVAVSDSGINKMMYSSNGTTWELIENINMDANYWNGVCWSPELGIFLTTSYNGTHKIAYSDDGLHWNLYNSTNIDSGKWYRPTWSSSLNLFVAMSDVGANRAMYIQPDTTTLNISASNTSIIKFDPTGWNSDVQPMFIADSSSEMDVVQNTITKFTSWSIRNIQGFTSYSNGDLVLAYDGNYLITYSVPVSTTTDSGNKSVWITVNNNNNTRLGYNNVFFDALKGGSLSGSVVYNLNAGDVIAIMLLHTAADNVIFGGIDASKSYFSVHKIF